jgi:hypothetical protein
MAKNRNTGGVPMSTNSFDGSLVTDVNDYHLPKNAWTHARNAINNTHIGDLGDISNEPGNKLCAAATYEIIGTIHLEKTKWVIFSTDDSNSEIGTFDSEKCVYETIVNAPCLNFKKNYIISGASRPTFDCDFQVYWQDNLNPDRTLVLGQVPWIQECVDDNGEEPGGCITCTDTDELDCDKLLLESHIKQPCYRLERSATGGNILNGSYYIQIAYMVNSQRVTDYFPMSNVLSLFTHEDINASIEIYLEDLDQSFDEYVVVIVSQVAEKLQARQLGIYSTNQNHISIDIIDDRLPAVRPDDLLINNPIADKSEGIFSVGKYLFRTGITGKFDFNYQPLANKIVAKWRAVQYPEYYYRDGGTNVGYMRDEVYAFFIRFVYKTGDRSNSYHIPGRAARNYVTPDGSGTLLESDDYTGGDYTVNSNNLEDAQGLTPKVFEMFNTASGAIVNIPLDDGGTVVAEGDMGYWESSEYYPDDTPEIWNTNDANHPEWDLCGTPIRHHKFPENTLYEGGGQSNIANHYIDGGESIRIMGVVFENIQPPVDNDGNPIPNIEGYEILRGSRDGNKTVLFKGLINNMREYDIESGIDQNRQGLYPNYPFNSIAYADAFNSLTETSFEQGDYLGYFPNPNVSNAFFTFHSPDTMFYKPFIGQKELKIYGGAYGDALAQYLVPDRHPKHVFPTDLAFIIGLLFGIGLAITKAIGKKTEIVKSPTHYSYPVIVGAGANTVPLLNNAGVGVQTGADLLLSGADSAILQGIGLVDAVFGTNLNKTTTKVAEEGGVQLNNVPGGGTTAGEYEWIRSDRDQIPPALKIAQGISVFFANVSDGTNLFLDLVRAFSKPQQFVRNYVGYCGYEKFGNPYIGNKRRLIDTANYLEPHLQNFKTTHQINNVLRSKTVAFQTDRGVVDLTGALEDNTMQDIKMSDLVGNDPIPDPAFERRASSHYVAMKTRLRNQYGQLQSIIQLPTQSCITTIDSSATETIFGGDTYIGRYQEKNTFYHFRQWLYDQPDYAEFNYHLYDTVPHTAFWMDTEPIDVGEFVESIGQAFTDFISSFNPNDFVNALAFPSDKACFDRDSALGFFTVKQAYIYLFHSSVRDFFVESELNIDHRDHGASNSTRHWDALQDLKTMFDMSIIKAGNFYKLDKGLSVSKLPFAKVKWGIMQDRDYNPTLAETCYTDYPLRLIYSLPQQTALKQDNWSVFLANNYKDFTSKVTAIKAIRSTGILLLFENESPGLYPGVDELQLKSGTSITVGDGGLFVREMQRLSNTDDEYEYGSCQSRRGTVNTPAGLYYMSQDQGKVFAISGGGIKEITVQGNNYWFNQYLPYQILKDFPDFDILDNPVAGVGCQMVYDNEWSILYMCKKDYRAKPEYLPLMQYIGDGKFLVNNLATIKVGDPIYFDDASWTISYDVKQGTEISWHDWHPGLAMGAPNSFFTTKGQTIWEHNKRCDLYCNYYNKDYPFEVEYQFDNLPAVTTVKNVEYFMQVFEYEENCRDRFHALDFNFDEAILYNSEQVTGLLKLTLQAKNNIMQLYQYPVVNLNDIEILYSKEEHKYRFNQFWDVTKDRGEFSNTTEPIWITEPNGYIKNLNNANLNYSKDEFQRKKLRHNNNRVLLRRNVCGNKNMILYLTNTKIQNSPR